MRSSLLWLMLSSAAACSGAVTESSTTADGNPPIREPVPMVEPSSPELTEAALASDPAALAEILAELRAHCAEHLEACRTAEEEHTPANWTRSETTAAFIRERRRRAEQLGVELVWSPGFSIQRGHITRPEADVHQMIGGHFTPAHIGPDAHAAVVARAEANPAHYVRMIRMVLGENPTPAWLSSVHTPAILGFLATHTDVSQEAERELALYERAVANPPDDRDENWSYRMRDRIQMLRQLTGDGP